MRLQKYLADAGVASRRKCEVLITEGRIKINGEVVTELGTQVADGDEVMFDDNIVTKVEKKVYYMLNKPEGYITSVTDDRGRQTVLDLLPQNGVRVFPVGRLDYNTSGMLLLTNDGDFTYKLTHPKHTVPKTYVATVKKMVAHEVLSQLRNGVDIDGYVTAPAKVDILYIENNMTTLQITIHEGKNRQIRKMCEAVGHTVVKLKRVAIGNIALNDLTQGSFRQLTPDEIKHFESLGG
ncbi:MAG: pseudouridine synthase [Epulopiscium sp. Nele67-Bin004]|nr:MAG: pseudouridine synthase [Epulopiscium sp. Nele67-Bin004]